MWVLARSFANRLSRQGQNRGCGGARRTCSGRQNRGVTRAPARLDTDKATAAALRERLRGLPLPAATAMREVMRLHAQGDRLLAGQWLLQAAALAPAHPEVLLWQGLMALERQEWFTAAQVLAQAAPQRPHEGRLWRLLGHAQGQAGDAPTARASLQRAAALTTMAADWLALSLECDAQGQHEDALAAVQALLRLDPRSAVGRLQRARCAKSLGHADEAAADCRALIRAGQEVARAWFSLVDLKTVRLSDAERLALEDAAQQPGWPAAEQQMLQFALGKALEDVGQTAHALAAFERANASVRAGLPWDAQAFSARVRAIRAAFDNLPAQPGSARGAEVIFIVGLPRSGSTLVEQVLASHAEVEGASELPTLPQVIDAESRRRGRPFPAWAAEASGDDWARLGQDYLRLTARWRQTRPRFTDKLPDNWVYTGAIRWMLPGARVIDCRRDALQTCWSCFKQLFAPDLAAYSYDFDSLARYARDCERLADHFAARHPRHVRVQRYEDLVAQPEAQTRALLAFCGLPFDAACLSPHQAQRAIRTPSALQVREPMQRISNPADAYGALLEPLRQALVRAAAERETA
jgi:tetratricopeptide (TPR) repeat protein